MDYVIAIKGIQQELHVKDWVCDLRGYAEKWKLRDGKPQRCGPWIVCLTQITITLLIESSLTMLQDVCPRGSTQENISIPLTENIPEKDYVRVNDFGDIPQDFLVDMEDYRYKLECEIPELAMGRAISRIRPEGGGVVEHVILHCFPRSDRINETCSGTLEDITLLV